MKVRFLIPTYRRPQEEFVSSFEKSIPVIKEAGWDEGAAWEIGHAYISYARSLLLRRALNESPDFDYIMYLDDDVCHEPDALLRILEAPGDIVGGTYRFKSPQEEYMGKLNKPDGEPVPERNRYGCYPAFFLPAGFLKISRAAVEIMVEAYPGLDFSRPTAEGKNCYDLFNHGVIKIGEEKTWFGEDYAFSLRAHFAKLKLWLLPDLNLGHHGVNIDGEKFDYMGNFQKFLDSTKEKDRTPNSMGLKAPAEEPALLVA